MQRQVEVPVLKCVLVGTVKTLRYETPDLPGGDEIRVSYARGIASVVDDRRRLGLTQIVEPGGKYLGRNIHWHPTP